TGCRAARRRCSMSANHLPLVIRVDGAVEILKMARKQLAEGPGIDRRKRGPRKVDTLLAVAIKGLETGIASAAAGGDIDAEFLVLYQKLTPKQRKVLHHQLMEQGLILRDAAASGSDLTIESL